MSKKYLPLVIGATGIFLISGLAYGAYGIIKATVKPTPTSAPIPTSTPIPTTTPPTTPSATPSATQIPTSIPTAILIACVGPDGKHLQISQKECDVFNNSWGHMVTITPQPKQEVKKDCPKNAEQGTPAPMQDEINSMNQGCPIITNPQPTTLGNASISERDKALADLENALINAGPIPSDVNKDTFVGEPKRYALAMWAHANQAMYDKLVSEYRVEYIHLLTKYGL